MIIDKTEFLIHQPTIFMKNVISTFEFFSFDNIILDMLNTLYLTSVFALDFTLIYKTF